MAQMARSSSVQSIFGEVGWMVALMSHFLHHHKSMIGLYKFCVDQGFPWSGDAYGVFVGPTTKGQQGAFTAIFITLAVDQQHP